jgi:hypothetical protein
MLHIHPYFSGSYSAGKVNSKALNLLQTIEKRPLPELPLHWRYSQSSSTLSAGFETKFLPEKKLKIKF